MVGVLPPTRLMPIALSVAVAIGVLASVEPFWSLGLAGAVVGIYALAQHALIRSIALIAGGLLVLWQSAEVTFAKVAYLGIILLVFFLGLNNIARHWSRARQIGAPVLLFVAATVGAVIALSGLVALSTGVSPEAWALDSTAYWLLIVAVVVGLDLGASDFSPRHVVALLLVAGLCTAAGYTLEWWGRRHLVDSGISHTLFPSMLLAGAAFSLAVSRAMVGKQPYLMGIIASILAGAIFIAGTRAAIFFLVPLVVIFVRARGWTRRRMIPLGLAAVATLVVIWSVVGVFAETGSLNLESVNNRIVTSVPLILSGDFTRDPSLYGRSLETSLLFKVWLQEPWLGVGPGHKYAIQVPGQSPLFDIVLVDSPVLPLARFGLIGVATLLALLAALSFSRLRRSATKIPAEALFAFISMVFVWAIVSSALDDKGVALGLVPLIGLAARERISA
jgi:hypothetical protein